MDPNKALETLRFFIAEARRLEDEQDDFADLEAWDNLHIGALLQIADAAEALDGWLSGGGFLPTAWNNGGYRA